MISEFTVPWVASESPHGFELGLQWIAAKEDGKKACGWSTLASLVTIKPDSELDMVVLKDLLQQVSTTLPTESNRTRYAMNNFAIAVGCSVKELHTVAIGVGKSLGKVTIDMGCTACKVPYAPNYIQKVMDKGVSGKKKKWHAAKKGKRH